MTLLPEQRQFITELRQNPIATCKTTLKRFLDNQTEKSWSFITLSLSVVCLGLIIAVKHEPIGNLISPILTPFQPSQVMGYGDSKNLETFVFAPGWATYKKLSRIDYRKLGTLSYYDLPIDTDGTFVYDSTGYLALQNPAVHEVFAAARQNGAKVSLTITQTYNTDIKRILNNQRYQQNLIDDSVRVVEETGADGVTIDFEFTGDAGSEYRDKFSSFVENFTLQMHERIPGSHVSIALGASESSDQLHDVPRLAKTVDKVFLMAYSIAAPEFDGEKLISPKHINSDEYMKSLDNYVAAYAADVPQNKLVIERAWYGNGDNYPLYKSDTAPKLGGSERNNTIKLPLSEKVVDRLVKNTPYKARAAARKNLPYIAAALEKEGMLNANVLAYALATIEHETAATFEPISEFKGRKSARRLGYEGGTNYYGRGFIQLTHARNYKKMGERIGLGDKLVKNPELASDPKIAAEVLAAFFKDNNVAYWANQGAFVTARIPINPDSQGRSIAMIAWGFLEELG